MMSLLRDALRSRRVLLIAIVPTLAIVLAVAGLFITGVVSDLPVLAQQLDNQCRGLPADQDQRVCLVQTALTSQTSNLGLVEEAIDSAEQIVTAGLVPLSSSSDRTDPNGDDPVLAQTSEISQKVIGNMEDMADALGSVAANRELPEELQARALRTQLSLLTVVGVMQATSQVTQNCKVGDTMAHSLDPQNPNPSSSCNQLLPLIDIDAVQNENPYVLEHMDPITRFTQIGLFPSYSVPLKADLVPPLWSREIPELVETTEALDIGQCSMVFKETRGLQLRLHLDEWTVVKTPVFSLTEGLIFVEEQEPIWSLEWQPVEYVRAWKICNKNGDLEVKVENIVNREEPLNFMWRYYEPGT